MQELAKQFKELKKIELTYSSVGSGEGIRRIAAHTVDFSLSDIPLTQYELASQGLVQFPVFASAIVPVINLPGLDAGRMTISAIALANIYIGKISRWNDPALQELNPHINLPDLPIKVVYRSDVSGTSYVFTSFLSKSDVNWGTIYGIGSRLKWPVGQGAKGSEGLVQTVKSTEGAIGYVEFGAAMSAQLAIPMLRVQGRLITARHQLFAESFNALTPVRTSFYKFVAAPSSLQDSWPIIAITNALVLQHPSQDDDVKNSLVFFSWVYQSGSSMIKTFNLLPLESKKGIASVEAQWKTITNEKGRSLWVGDGSGR
jgi:phosphate transport system substrate-binding protein